jgi:hypothetical protein
MTFGNARSTLAPIAPVAYMAIIGSGVGLAAFVVLLLLVLWDRRGARNYWDD